MLWKPFEGRIYLGKGSVPTSHNLQVLRATVQISVHMVKGTHIAWELDGGLPEWLCAEQVPRKATQRDKGQKKEL